MKSKIATGVIALLLAAPVSVYALGKNEKGCLAGGAIGGIGGHLIGSGSTTNTLLGAAAGCAVGTVVQQKKKDDRGRENRAQERERAKTARYNDSRRERELERERRINGQS